MATEQQDQQKPPNPAPKGALRAWVAPELISYGSFRRLTQGRAGSTGESGNYSMMMGTCL